MYYHNSLIGLSIFICGINHYDDLFLHFYHHNLNYSLNLISFLYSTLIIFYVFLQFLTLSSANSYYFIVFIFEINKIIIIIDLKYYCYNFLTYLSHFVFTHDENFISYYYQKFLLIFKTKNANANNLPTMVQIHLILNLDVLNVLHPLLAVLLLVIINTKPILTYKHSIIFLFYSLSKFFKYMFLLLQIFPTNPTISHRYHQYID